MRELPSTCVRRSLSPTYSWFLRPLFCGWLSLVNTDEAEAVTWILLRIWLGTLQWEFVFALVRRLCWFAGQAENLTQSSLPSNMMLLLFWLMLPQGSLAALPATFTAKQCSGMLVYSISPLFELLDSPLYRCRILCCCAVSQAWKSSTVDCCEASVALHVSSSVSPCF